MSDGGRELRPPQDRGVRDALALGLASALLSVPLTYAVTRVIQARLYPDPDPALVVWSTRIAMYWRIAIGLYVGAMVAPLAFFLARRDVALAASWLRGLVVLSAAAIALQAAFVP